MFPYAVGATMVAMAATPAHSEPECPPSPLSPAFRASGGATEETDSCSTPSASSSSSAAGDDFIFSTSSGKRSPSTSTSTSTSAMCFGAGGAGMRMWSSSRALARASKIHEEEDDDDGQAAAAATSVAPKGDAAAWRYLQLRRISRRPRKARAAATNKKTTPAGPRSGAVDDTARERADAVASAVAHCKDTLRRGGGAPARLRRRRLPPPLSSLSLDLWLRDTQDEIIASAAAHCDDDDDECGGSRPPPCAAAFPTTNALARHAPCMRLLPHASIQSGRESAAAAAAGTPPSSEQIRGPVTSMEVETRGGFSELEFLETLDGDEELIDRHFITVQI